MLKPRHTALILLFFLLLGLWWIMPHKGTESSPPPRESIDGDEGLGHLSRTAERASIPHPRVGQDHQPTAALPVLASSIEDVVKFIKAASPAFGESIRAEQWHESFLPKRMDHTVVVSLHVCREAKYKVLRIEQEFRSGEEEAGTPTRTLVSVADHVVVKKNPEVDELLFLKAIREEGWALRKKLPMSGCYLIDLQRISHDALPFALKQLHHMHRDICTAQADFLFCLSAIPNDPQFGKNWGLANDGQTGGLPGVDIGARQAWEVQKGSRDVVVGIIDSGVDYTHPDLAANIYSNPGESGSGKETNGVDDDGNGLVDDFRGWDFANDDNDPMDDYYHGTHCAGTVGAKGNNGDGISGVCWDVSLMPLKIFKVQRFSGRVNGSVVIAPSSDALDAIAYSSRMGVSISSNSWGGRFPVSDTEFLPLLRSQIQQAGAAGQIFIAAAGNESFNNDSEIERSYPASFDLDNVLTVAATDHRDNLAPFSNYGATRVHVAAPGSDIFSTFPTQKNDVLNLFKLPTHYKAISGTSMACPHVAGIAALIKAQFPASSPAAIKQRIVDNVDLVPALNGKVSSGGRVNADAALHGSVAAARIVFKSWRPRETIRNNTFNPGETWDMPVTIENRGVEAASAVTGTLTCSSPYIQVTQSTATYGNLDANASANGNFSIYILPDTPTPLNTHLVFTFADSAGHSWEAKMLISVLTMANVTGVVSNAATSAPIAGATGIINGTREYKMAKTKADGVYSIPTVDGPQELTIRADGYFDSQLPVHYQRGAANPVALDVPMHLVVPAVNPPALTIDLAEGESKTENISLAASGTRSLEWKIATNATEYKVDSSLEPGGPAYVWNEISTLSGAEEISASIWTLSIPFGFEFPFFGRMYERFHFSPHGYLSLASSQQLYTLRDNPPVPSQMPTESVPLTNSEMVAWLWENYEPGLDTRVLVKQTDATTFVIQVENLPFKSNGNKRLTCQIVLKADGSITVHYKDPGFTNRGSVGLQDVTRRKGVSVAFNQDYLRPLMTTRLRPQTVQPWVTAATTTGSTQAETSTTLPVTLNGTGLPPGTYTAHLILTTNSPSAKTLLYPVSLRIGAPRVPVWVIASDSGEHSDRIRISWEPISGITSYEIQRRAYPSGFFAPIATVNNSTTYDDLEVAAGTTHSYRVVSLAGSARSQPSVEETGVRGNILDAARVGIHPFGQIAYQNGTVSRITVNWYENLPQLPSGSKLEFSDDEGDTFITLATWPGQAPTHFGHSGYNFRPGSAYLYRFYPDASSETAVEQYIIVPGELIGPVPGSQVGSYAWAAAAFGEENLDSNTLADEGADPDHDGISNLMEYALGTSPTTPSLQSPIRFLLAPSSTASYAPPGFHLLNAEPSGALYPTLVFPRNPDATDLTYTVEWSSNLIDWFSGDAFTARMDESSIRPQIQSRFPSSTKSTQFLRLKVDK
ncbi:MAG: S8 family serine peptidase [Verrucomicrobia bacterium]|nr:S8 family serine peptidase [Verrucomicrobiota bacterium]